jgi:zona occludens toxin
VAVNSYVGLPGSGKSYGVVEHVVLPSLKDNRRIWTNIPLNLDTLAKAYPEAPTPVIFDSIQITDNPAFFQDVFDAGATIIIDEAWRFWPAGLKANDMKEGHKSFFAEHRHMVGEDGESTEIIVVTQDLAQVCTVVRNLTETTYRAVKLVVVGSNKGYRIDVYQGAVTGPNPPEKLRVRQLFGSYKKNIYQHYKSQTMSAASGHVKEKTADKRINILNSNWLKFGAPSLLLVLGSYIWYALSDVSNMYNGSEDSMKSKFDSNGKPPEISQQPKAPPVSREELAITSFLQENYVYIASNMGNWPFIKYQFHFVNSDQDISTLSESDLRTLGYKFLPINPCLVKLSTLVSDRIIQCHQSDRPEDNYQEETDSSEIFAFNGSSEQ